jgi:hypothetical protein
MRVARIHKAIDRRARKRQRDSAYAAGTPNNSDRAVAARLTTTLLANEPGKSPVHKDR